MNTMLIEMKFFWGFFFPFMKGQHSNEESCPFFEDLLTVIISIKTNTIIFPEAMRNLVLYEKKNSFHSILNISK